MYSYGLIDDGEGDVEDNSEEEREVEELLSQDNEFDLIFYNYTRLLENLRSQCLDFGYKTSSSDEEERQDENEDE